MPEPPPPLSVESKEPPPPAKDSSSALQRSATVACLTATVLGVTAFLYFARAFVLPLVIAWVASTVLNPPVRWLRDWKFPAPLAALIVMLAILAPVIGAFSHFSAPVAQWFEQAPEDVARLKQRLRTVLRPAQRLSEAAASVGASTRENGPPSTAKIELNDHRLTSSVFSWTAGAMVTVGEILALTFLLLASGDVFLQRFVHLMPTLRDKARAVEITRELRHSMSTYLFSILLVNLGLGTILATLLWQVGMPQPVMWGALAALFNCVPYFGAVLGVLLVGLAGLNAFDAPGHGLLPAALYLGLHLIEANIVTPMVVGRRFTLNPVIVFTALIFFVWLWGAAGALVAMPILVSAKIVCARVPLLNPVSAFLSK